MLGTKAEYFGRESVCVYEVRNFKSSFTLYFNSKLGSQLV